VRQKVTNHANNNSNNWSAADLVTPVWHVVYLDAISVRTAKLNTLKHHLVKPIYEDFLGVPDIGSAWSAGTTLLDDFVKARGDVAHQGGQSKYVRFAGLLGAQAMITQTAKETDNFLSDHIRVMVTPPRLPWNRIP
jgi:hypothetical protein